MNDLFDFARTGSDVFAQSAGLTAPAVIETPGLRGTVLEEAVLGSLHAMRDSPLRDAAADDLRVYTGGTHEPRATEDFLRCDPGTGTAQLEAACRRTFGDTEFTVVVNKVEKWFPPVAPAVASIATQLQRSLAGSLLHAELLYFIGDSRFTPFGIHIDDAADALHFNFGPSPRQISLWEPDRFAELTGGRRSSFETARLAEHGGHHPVRQGDLFFLPATRYYHVAENHGFSVSMVLTLIQYAPDRVVRRAMRSRSSEMVPRQREADLIGSLLEQVEAGEAVEAPHAGPTVDVAEAVSEYVLRIRSNGGFRATPRPVEVPALDDAVVRRVRPFPLVLQQGPSGTVKIFARGAVISVPDRSDIRGLIRSLGGEENVEVADLAASPYARRILAELVRISAVEVV